MLCKSRVIYDVNKVTQQSEFWTTFTWAIKKWTKRWAEIVLSYPIRENCKCIIKKAILKKRVKAWRWHKKITRWYKIQLRISVYRHKKGCFSQLIFSHLAASLDIKGKVWKLLKKGIWTWHGHLLVSLIFCLYWFAIITDCNRFVHWIWIYLVHQQVHFCFVICRHLHQLILHIFIKSLHKHIKLNCLLHWWKTGPHLRIQYRIKTFIEILIAVNPFTNWEVIQESKVRSI